jgi:HSP20 family protein
MSLIPWKWGAEDRGLAVRGERDPFTALQREMARAFDSFLSDDFFRGPMWSDRAEWMAPKLDLSETANDVHVTVELPGLSEKDIDVELRDNMLRIRGEKKDVRETKEHNFHRTERMFGSFERVVPLPAKVRREGVDAKFKDGVLTVVLPKVEPSQVEQKIPVQAGA